MLIKTNLFVILPVSVADVSSQRRKHNIKFIYEMLCSAMQFLETLQLNGRFLQKLNKRKGFVLRGIMIFVRDGIQNIIIKLTIFFLELILKQSEQYKKYENQKYIVKKENCNF